MREARPPRRVLPGTHPRRPAAGGAQRAGARSAAAQRHLPAVRGTAWPEGLPQAPPL